DHFAEGENENGKDRAKDGGLKGKDQPGKRSDKRPKDNALERGELANQVVDEHGEADDGEAVGDEDKLDVGARADVAMNVAGKRDVLLPEDNPVAGEDQQKKHEFWIAENGQEIFQRFRNAGWRSIAEFFRFAEENQDGEEHQEDAESRHAKNIF